jgi:hypothetical protein
MKIIMFVLTTPIASMANMTILKNCGMVFNDALKWGRVEASGMS